MGMGDELMAVSCAKKESDRLGGGKIYILDRHDRARSHTLFEHYDFIARLEDQYGVVGRVRNGPGVRPYIDYEATAPGRESPWRYTQWSVNSVGPAPDVWPSMPMKDGPNILLHPHKKPGASPNKMWGWERWQRLADLPQLAGRRLQRGCHNPGPLFAPQVTGSFRQLKKNLFPGDSSAHDTHPVTTHRI